MQKIQEHAQKQMEELGKYDSTKQGINDNVFHISWIPKNEEYERNNNFNNNNNPEQYLTTDIYIRISIVRNKKKY